MEKTAVIMIGIQGSGKSTFYRRYLCEDYVRINLDVLKTRHRESELLRECIENGKSFAVDNTNPTKADRARYVIPAKEAGYKVICCFMESKLALCIERNNRREGKEKIAPSAIAATSNKLQMPEYDEGFDKIYFVKNDGSEMIVEDWRV